MGDSKQEIDRDVLAVQRIGAVPTLLKLICQNTGMGFAAVARVTDGTWTACAVQDDIAFGLQPGGQLPVGTTLCSEARAARAPVVIDNASVDPVYREHHTPRLYHIESYISVPIVRPGGEYFGNLCAIDPRPHVVSDPKTVAMFTAFAELIAHQLASEDRELASESALATEKATAELREQFIAVLGHDLRNPLAAVAATADALVQRQSDPALVKIGQRLRSTTRRMATLIDDVLDFARGRLGAGIDTEFGVVVDLSAALADVVAESREANPGRALRADIADCGAVRCDRGRLQQLLSNLVGNAITHGAADRPVDIAVRVDDESLEIAVSNEGEPIPPESLTRLFEPFSRPLTGSRGGGLGLGLYICSQIAKAHGGAIDVRSSAEHGTTFVARLPVVVRR